MAGTEGVHPESRNASKRSIASVKLLFPGMPEDRMLRAARIVDKLQEINSQPEEHVDRQKRNDLMVSFVRVLSEPNAGIFPRQQTDAQGGDPQEGRGKPNEFTVNRLRKRHPQMSKNDAEVAADLIDIVRRDEEKDAVPSVAGEVPAETGDMTSGTVIELLSRKQQRPKSTPDNT